MADIYFGIRLDKKDAMEKLLPRVCAFLNEELKRFIELDGELLCDGVLFQLVVNIDYNYAILGKRLPPTISFADLEKIKSEIAPILQTIDSQEPTLFLEEEHE